MANLSGGSWTCRHILNIFIPLSFAIGVHMLRSKAMVLLFSLYVAVRLITFVSTSSLQDIPAPHPKTLPRAIGNHKKAHDDNEEQLFADFPEISFELDQIFDNVIRDFVRSWFNSISSKPDSPFPREVKRNLRHITRRLRELVDNVDLSEFLVLKTLPIITRHFTTFCTSRETVISDKLIEKAQMEELPFAIAVEFSRNLHLHPAIPLGSSGPGDSVEKYLQAKANFILRNIVDEDELDSKFVRIILREILTCTVLAPLVHKLSDPDFWNLKIVSFATGLLKERSQVEEFRAVLSKEVQSTKDDIGPTVDQMHSIIELNIDENSTDKDFEDFLRQINNSLDSVHALKSAKFSMMIKLIRLLESPNMTKSQQELKKRLLLSLNLIESRLGYITGNFSSKPTQLHNKPVTQLREFKKFMRSITLEDILGDEFCRSSFDEYLLCTNPSGRTYLSFWTAVESIRNPLEDPANEELAMDVSENGFVDLQNAYQEFFTGKNFKLMTLLGADYVNEIVEYMRLSRILEREELISYYFKARKSLLLLQIEAFKALEEAYPKFQNSSMFPQMIAASEFQKTEPFKKYINSSHQVTAPKEDLDKKLQRVRIDGNGDITKALDDILESNVRDKSITKPKAKKSFSSLFGNNEDKEIFKNNLFDDNSITESGDSDSNDSIVEDNDTMRNFDENFENETQKENLSDSQQLEFSDLKDKIAEMTISIDLLKKQLLLLNHLILKAELTNKSSQLKLLRKSERSVSKELENKELLRQQYIVQENANSLFGKCKISIRSYLTDTSAENGKEVVYYVINVCHFNNNETSCWDVPRRFNEFYKLNGYLRKNYGPLVKHLQNKDCFPEKVKISLIYHVSKSLLYEERVMKLEIFLRRLLIIPEICQDRVFRRFLTDTFTSFDVDGEANDAEKRHSLLSRIESIPSKMGNLTVNNGTDILVDSPLNSGEHAYSDVGRELEFLEDERNFYNGNASEKKLSFVKPICDFSIALFSLNNSNTGWLRGRAILVVLQQLFGSTIEKYIKISLARATSEERILEVISTFRSSFWTDGYSKQSSPKSDQPLRTSGEIKRTEMEAKKKLEKLLVETCGKVVGIKNSRKAGIKMHAMFQNQYLNASLTLQILDLLIDELFQQV